MIQGIPLSPFSLWEKVRMRAIKSFLAIENFRMLVEIDRDVVSKLHLSKSPGYGTRARLEPVEGVRAINGFSGIFIH